MEPKQEFKEKSEVRNAFGPTEDEIRKRAYEIYLARGARPGTALQDWLQAEAELRQGRKIFL